MAEAAVRAERPVRPPPRALIRTIARTLAEIADKWKLWYSVEAAPDARLEIRMPVCRIDELCGRLSETLIHASRSAEAWNSYSRIIRQSL